MGSSSPTIKISRFAGIGLAVVFACTTFLYTGIVHRAKAAVSDTATAPRQSEQLAQTVSTLSALEGMVRQLRALFDLKVTRAQSATIQNVVWTGPVNVTVSGNSIQKTSGCDGCADAGAISSQQITAGDGYVEFTVPQAGKQLYAGLGNGNINTSEADVDFAINTTGPGNTAGAYENDVYKADTGVAISAGDILRVAVVGGQVRYSRNGVVFYTSTRTPVYPLLVDTSLLNTGGQVSNAAISYIPPDITPPIVGNSSPSGAFPAGTTSATLGVTTIENATCRASTIAGTLYASMSSPFTTIGGTSHSMVVTGLTNGTGYVYFVRCQDAAGNANMNDLTIAFSIAAPASPPPPPPPPSGPAVVWTSIVNAVVTGVNDLQENCGCWNSGAVSSQTIFSGDGYAEFAVGANLYFVAGLSNGNTNQADSDIDFGIRFNGAGGADVFENGVYMGGDVSYAVNDVFRVAILGGQVKYSKNGTVFFTSSKGPVYPLLLDTSLDPGALIKNAMISGSATPPVRSSGLPTGTLSAGTLSAMLSLTTDENATCKYGTSAGVAYASLPATFSATGALSHTTTVTGITNGSSYTYYVRCRDAAGNVNTSDFVISFSVATAVPPPAPTLSVTLTAAPTSGNASLPVNLRADVSGTAVGTINYTGYCNRTDTGVNITTPNNAKLDGTTINPYTFTCTYVNPGNHTAKIIVERGGFVAQAQAQITVTSPPLSTKFAIGDRVQATVILNVRATANGTLLGTQAMGNQAVVIGGPTFAAGSWWWNINYDTGIDGWSSETFLVKVVSPPPPPPPPPSTKFQINDRVQASAVLNVRGTPAILGTLLGTQLAGALGTVTGGPVSADGFAWWQINYDDGFDGWSAEDFLTKIVVPPPPPTDITPPVRSSGFPSGTLSAGITSATLSLATDENATCKYGVIAGVAYASLPNTFGTTGGMPHASTVIGLTNGSSYTYYVRCRDAAGNVNTNDFTISFSVGVVVPPPTSGNPNPTRLPVAITSQVPLTVLYSALNIPAIAAGESYFDPLTGVKVYKLTSAVFPTSGSSWGHAYAEGGDEVSLLCNGKRAIHVYSGSAHWLIDFAPGGGVSNPRQMTGSLTPANELSFAFSSNPATPCYAYTANTSGVITRFDFSTMATAPGGGWPVTDLGPGQFEWPVWLHQTENDTFFTWMRGANGATVVGYEPGSGTKKTYTNSGANEPRIDRDSSHRSVAISMTTPQNQALFWDWNSNTITWSSPLIPYASPPVAHNASLHGYWVGTDWNANYPWPFWSISATPNSVINPLPGGIAQGGGHCSGNWNQHPVDPKDQWFVCYYYGGLVPTPAANLADAPGGILLATANGARRVLAQLYNTSGDYTFFGFAKFAPDGKYVLFTSNMNGSNRSDLFLAELPTSP